VLQQLDTFKKEKKRLADSVWEFCTTTTCYRKKLLNYFGEKTKNKCNSCSNCLKNKTTIEAVVQELITLLTNRESLSLEQLILASKYDREDIIEALNDMANEELIEQIGLNFYTLK
jgi:ATP-dependent DNA helicase RecQ